MLVSLCFSGRAVAKDTKWTGNAGDGLWITAGNWDNGLPGLPDEAAVYSAGPPIALNTGASSITWLEMGGNSANSTINVNVGRQSSSQHWYTQRWVSIDARGGKTGRVNVQSGDVLFGTSGTASANRSSYIGLIGTGVVEVTGTSYLWMRDVYLAGDLPPNPEFWGLSGNLIISNNAVCECLGLVAAGYNGNGYINVNDNGLLRLYGVNKELILGNTATSTGTLNQTGGAVQVNGNTIVGNDGTGTLSMSDGLFEIKDDGASDPKLIVAQGVNSTGTVNLNGGTLYSKGFPDVDDDSQATSAVINFNTGKLYTRHTASTENNIRQAIIDGKFSNGVSSDPDHYSWYIAQIPASQNPYLHNGSPTDIWVVQSPPPASGQLIAHPYNPQYFMIKNDPEQKPIYMTGSHTWAEFQDYVPTGQNYDYTNWIQDLYDWNHNFMRGWYWEDGYYSPLPFTQTGGKYNLTQYNTTFFDRVDTRVNAAIDKGLFVGIMIFQGPSLDDFWLPNNPLNKCRNPNPWPVHPFDGGNNNNGIDGDPNHDNDGSETHTLQIPAVTALQEDYVEHVIDTFNYLDNIVWEISNESRWPSLSWMNHMINHVKSYEAANYPGREHLVWVNNRGDWDGQSGRPSNADLFNGPADIVSPNTETDDYLNNPPIPPNDKIVIADSDHISPVQANEVFVWKNFTRGNHVLTMDWGYDGLAWWTCSTLNPSDPKLARMRNGMGRSRNYADRMDLVNVTPQNGGTSPCNTGYCLYDTGKNYVCYQPSNGANITVNLPAGTYYYEWFNISNNAIPKTGVYISSGGNHTFTNPTSVDCSLYLEEFGGNTVSTDLGRYNSDVALHVKSGADGDNLPTEIGDRECRTNQVAGSDIYMYFDVNDYWAYQGNRPVVWITLGYYDSGTENISLQYQANGGTTYKNGGSVSRNNTDIWKTYTWYITDAYFGNGQINSADFRISGGATENFYFDTITVTDVEPPDPNAAYINLGTNNIENNLYIASPADGDHVQANIGGRDCRKNEVAGQDKYMYFRIDDLWAYQGSQTEVWITMEYYDSGTENFKLQYDATDGTYYKNSDSIDRTNTNAWKAYLWHVTDAYFGNNQNGASDFRFWGGDTEDFYIDTVEVTTVPQGPQSPVAVINANPIPVQVYLPVSFDGSGSYDPDGNIVSYEWDFEIDGTVDSTEISANYTYETIATHTCKLTVTDNDAMTGSNTIEITVVPVTADFDADGDVDHEDFGHLQECYTGHTVPITDPSCQDADLDDDGHGDADLDDFNIFLNCMNGANMPPCCE
jgi:hypothetical protein